MLPLDDILVLDLSRVLSGPYCSMYLGDFGARVVKVEPPNGDDTRGFGPPFVGGESTYFMSVNRNKESIVVDLKTERGKKLVGDLAARADVLLENFRPGTLEKFDLNYETLAKKNPLLIYASISGFGHHGLAEWVQRPGYDVVIQGMGGAASLTGEPDGPPLKFGVSVADLVSGLYALSGILVALHARARNGRGQHVDVSMLDGQISLLTYHAGMYFATGRSPSRLGNRHPSIVPYETFLAADGYVNIAVGNDSLWRAFCAEVGAPLSALANDDHFASNRGRVEHRLELAATLDPLIAKRSVAEWLQICERAKVPAGPILNVAEALSHPQIAARQMIASVAHPTAGELRVTGVPIRLSETPGKVRTPPPRLGEHSRHILRELGVSDAECDELLKSGVVASGAPGSRR